MNGVSGAPMPVKVAEALRRLPHVAVVAPVNHPPHHAAQDRDPLRHRLRQLQRPQALRLPLPAALFRVPTTSSSTTCSPARNGYHVGDTIDILNHPFRICGIVEHGKGGRKLLPIDTMGALIGTDGKASIFYLKTDDPANDQADHRRRFTPPPALKTTPSRPWRTGSSRR